VFSSEKFCKVCGHVGGTKRHMPGSIFIEIILRCCLIVPGLIYSVWRHSASKQVCKSCGSNEVIPTDSPIAKQLLAQQPAQPSPPPTQFP
jgi:rRNA maturation endonuclease Nob1